MQSPDTLVEDAAELVAASSWYEARLHCQPESLYRSLAAQAPGAVLMFHHFYEPWHPTGAVARLLVVGDRKDQVLSLLDRWEAVVGVQPWEREDGDRELYGEDFEYAMMFFQGSSALASHKHGEWMTQKLIHCVLNARNMSVAEEARWGIRFVWGRLTIKPYLWWRSLRTGREWWQ